MEGPLDGVAAAPELDHAVARGENEDALDEALEGEQPQDERVTQRAAPRHEWRVGGRTGHPRLAQHEVAAAQAPPGRAHRRLRVQPGTKVVLDRRVRQVSTPSADPQVHIHRSVDTTPGHVPAWQPGSSIGAVEKILRAAGLESYQAQQVRIHDETVVVVRPAGDAQRLLRSARAALPDHYPVLALYSGTVLDPDLHHDSRPGDLIAAVETTLFDTGRAQDPEQLGTGDEGFDLGNYDVTHFGEPELLVILPRPEPWAAFAYLNPYGVWGTPGDVMLAAAHRWHERYGAEPTTIGLANAFTVSRPPTDPADAERLAIEHVAIAGLTAGTTTRAYARALLQLDRWCLYDRP